MKTTVDLEAGLFKAARKLAIDQGRPFRAVLNDALRTYLGMPTPAGTAPGRRKQPRRAAASPPGAQAEAPAPRLEEPGSAAQFWAIVNDRSRWDELFEDRTRKIEAQIAEATARWNRRHQP